MPFRCKIIRDPPFVEITADTTITPDDVESLINQLRDEKALPYPKLLDASLAKDLLSMPALRSIGLHLRQIMMSGNGPLGPLGIVVTSREDFLRAGQYADVSGALRPLRAFRTRDQAAAWLAQLATR